MSIITIGRVVGKSAYEVALDNGFVGTEQEWLDSLTAEIGQGLAIIDNKIELVNMRDNTPISIWIGTQEEYDAIEIKDMTVLYNILEEI